MPEETPPDVVNLQAEETVDWLVARRRKLGIPKKPRKSGTVDWNNPARDTDEEDD
jgi:hypothetical protein